MTDVLTAVVLALLLVLQVVTLLGLCVLVSRTKMIMDDMDDAATSLVCMEEYIDAVKAEDPILPHKNNRTMWGND